MKNPLFVAQPQLSLLFPPSAANSKYSCGLEKTGEAEVKVCQAGKRSFSCCWERSSSDEKMPSFAAIAQIWDVGQIPRAVLR